MRLAANLLHGEDPPMSPVEAFLRHAAECKRMAVYVGDAQSRFVWIGMAERWLRCAKVYQSERTSLESNRKAKLRCRLARGSPHLDDSPATHG
jgi:hypothetical protein